MNSTDFYKANVSTAVWKVFIKADGKVNQQFDNRRVQSQTVHTRSHLTPAGAPAPARLPSSFPLQSFLGAVSSAWNTAPVPSLPPCHISGLLGTHSLTTLNSLETPLFSTVPVIPFPSQVLSQIITIHLSLIPSDITYSSTFCLII